MKRSLFFLQSILLSLFLLVSASPVKAFVTGGVAKVSLSPGTSSIPVGQTSTVKVMFNTSGVKISGVSLKLSFSSTSNDLELVSAVKDNSSGLTFPFEPVVTKENGVTTIVIEAIDFSTSGYSNTANTPLATLTLKANSSFSGRPIQFNQSDSKILDKAEAKDILGNITNGTYSSSTTTITESPTSTVTESPTATVTTTITESPTNPPTESPLPEVLPDTGFSLPGLGVLGGGILIVILGLLFML